MKYSLKILVTPIRSLRCKIKFRSKLHYINILFKGRLVQFWNKKYHQHSILAQSSYNLVVKTSVDWNNTRYLTDSSDPLYIPIFSYFYCNSENYTTVPILSFLQLLNLKPLAQSEIPKDISSVLKLPVQQRTNLQTSMSYLQSFHRCLRPE